MGTQPFSDGNENHSRDFKPEGSAIEQVAGGYLPKYWSFVPVDSNKATYLSWGKGGQTWQNVQHSYQSNFHLRPDQISKFPGCAPYSGVGVLSGAPSMGLVTIDIDGHTADARWKKFLGEHYEEHGKETTMAWWSGTPGRRQIAYMLPPDMVPTLEGLNSYIYKEDGTWETGQGDKNRTAEDRKNEYEEVVVRFNRCMSVLPGSQHPSGRQYQWLNYNGGEPARAPEWLIELLLPLRNARSGWDLILQNREDQEALEDCWKNDQRNKKGTIKKESIKGSKDQLEHADQ